jgi:hypothetical protein
MRKFKVKYAIVKINKFDIERNDSTYSERFECETFEEAIEYGKKKAESLGLHFEGVEELAR